MMYRRFIGAVLILLGAIVISINVLWFQNHELYDTARIASFVSFIAGFLLIPRYQEGRIHRRRLGCSLRKNFPVSFLPRE